MVNLHVTPVSVVELLTVKLLHSQKLRKNLPTTEDLTLTFSTNIDNDMSKVTSLCILL